MALKSWVLPQTVSLFTVSTLGIFLLVLGLESDGAEGHNTVDLSRRAHLPFSFITTDEGAMRNFESLKVEASPQVETRSQARVENVTHLNVVRTEPHPQTPQRNTPDQVSRKHALATVMRQQFRMFKQRLTRKVEDRFVANTESSPSANPKADNEAAASGKSLNSQEPFPSSGGHQKVQIGELVTKSERRAGEEPSGIHSGVLSVDSHPIQVTFTSLPGFPAPFPRTTTTTTAVSGVSPATASVIPGGTIPPVRIDNNFGGHRTSGVRGASFSSVPGTGVQSTGVSGASFSSVPGTGVQAGGFGAPSLRPTIPSARPSANNGSIRDLMRLLEARLIGGLGGVENRNVEGIPGTASPIQQFDPSIVVNFLTLVALSQQQRQNSGAGGGGGVSLVGGPRARTSGIQRNVAPPGGPPLHVDTPSSDGEFGPFSNGADPSAGVDPSSIVLPPMLRQTLYSYLLPRLASLSALVETVPGVPGVDYPIISVVPYTNFYCSDMPWPGFYADTEARCQAWHYCDLDGRQASFLCPNGTIFNQAFFVCDWWYNFDCESAPYIYSLNERVFALPEVDETAPHRAITAEILDTIFL